MGRAQSAADRNIPPGWVSATDSVFNRVDRYTSESVTPFAGGRVEVRRFSWARPMGSTWETGKRCYLFNMSLSNAEPAATWTHLETGLQEQRKVRGGLTFVPPGQRMSSSFGAGRSRSLCCMLDASVIERYLTETPDWKCSRALLRDCARLGGTEIEWLLRRMYREVREPDFATSDALATLAKQLAIEVVRRFKLRPGASDHRVGGLSPSRMRLIRERVFSDAPLPDLEELASRCDITVRHLARAFRIETGQTLGKYIQSVMVERAQVLLHSPASVKQVAALLGYSHSGAFASAFRRATGLRPSQIKITSG